LGDAKGDIGKKFALPERFAKILNRKVIHSTKVRKRRPKIFSGLFCFRNKYLPRTQPAQ
jgi:hypothetical protein